MFLASHHSYSQVAFMRNVLHVRGSQFGQLFQYILYLRFCDKSFSRLDDLSFLVGIVASRAENSNDRNIYPMAAKGRAFLTDTCSNECEDCRSITRSVIFAHTEMFLRCFL